MSSTLDQPARCRCGHRRQLPGHTVDPIAWWAFWFSRRTNRRAITGRQGLVTERHASFGGSRDALRRSLGSSGGYSPAHSRAYARSALTRVYSRQRVRPSGHTSSSQASRADAGCAVANSMRCTSFGDLNLSIRSRRPQSSGEAEEVVFWGGWG